MAGKKPKTGVTQTEFADLCGVKRQAIGKAIAAGYVVLNEHRRIDLDSEVNKHYIGKRTPQRQNKMVGPGSDERRKHILPPSGGTDDGYSNKAEADLAKTRAQTAKLHVEMARELNVLIHQEVVDKAFGALNGAFVSHILPQGFRIAEEICALFADSSPEKKLAVQKIVDDENEKMLEEIKRETVDKVLENPNR
jgi:phage terminase Nu1 subunit (DNA packaging protein)